MNTDIMYKKHLLPHAKRKGEGNEATVAAVLYDITDGINASEGDNVSFPNDEIWELTKANNCIHLSSFITALYASSSYSNQPKVRLGSTLGGYKVCAKLNTIDLTGSTPKFNWKAQGQSSGFPHYKYRIAIYDSSFNRRLRTSYKTSTLTEDSITLTTSQWNTIINWGSPVVYCCVETVQTDSPQTGPYWGNPKPITISTPPTPTTNTYTIKNNSTGKYLNIYGSNVTYLTNHQNVCLWSGSGSNEQKWKISSLSNNVYIRSVIDNSYGLNVYRTGSPWNCDMMPVAGNEQDAAVDIVEVSGGYKIKLHNHNNLYLSADSSSNGSNVYWSASSSSLYQIWTITPVQ